MKIGVIGTGNLATSVITGSIRSEKFCGEDFCLYDLFPEKVRELHQKFGTASAASAVEVAESCDVVILAVKPKDFPQLLQSVGAALQQKDPLVLSVAAGLTKEYICSFLPYAPKLARLMTNINASVCGAMTAYCPNDRVTDEERAFLETFCASFGDAIELEESFFPQFGVLAGCVPAFVYKFVDELARAGVQMGFRKDVALRIAANTVCGGAKVAAESDVHPYTLIDRVCTPGGTTIDGIMTLDALGFDNAVHKAVWASYEKDQKLTKH